MVGHAFTSAPSKCYEFATASFSWHLRPDGTDRRTYTTLFGPNGEMTKEQQSEYDLVPFELFEFIYRRILGGSLTLAAGALSPVGLVAKSIHLAVQ